MADVFCGATLTDDPTLFSVTDTDLTTPRAAVFTASDSVTRDGPAGELPSLKT